jgi:hypothetical protein
MANHGIGYVIGMFDVKFDVFNCASQNVFRKSPRRLGGIGIE